MVSIITPVYNCEKYVVKNIKSVQNQTYRDYEHILIDDCSVDDTSLIINKYLEKDSRIRLIKLDVNKGAGFCRNTGVREANGRFIAFLDSDDYWAPKKLEKQISFMKVNNFVFTVTQYYEFDNETGEVTTLVKIPEKITYTKLLLNGGFIGCLTVIYDTSFFGKRYMPEIRKRQDWALWLKMLKEIEGAHGLQEPLAYYRKGNASLSKNKIKLVKHNFGVFRRELGMSLLESVYRMFLFLIYHLLFKSSSKVKL